MKKIFLLFILFFLTFAPKSNAVNYEMRAVKIEVEVLPNQDLGMREYIVQEGDFNGYIRDLVYRNPTLPKFDGTIRSFEQSDLYNATGIENIKIYQGILDGESITKGEEFVKVDRGESGASFVYELSDLENGYRLKMFQAANWEKKCYIIEYTLKDVVVLHEDVSELYYNFIGDAFDDFIEEVELILHLPDNTLNEKPRAWAHGPLEGTIQIPDNKTVYANIAGLFPQTAIDLRVTFNQGLIQTAKKKTGINALEKIIEVESERANAANEIRKENLRSYYEHLLMRAERVLESKNLDESRKTGLRKRVGEFKNSIEQDLDLADIEQKYNELYMIIEMLEREMRQNSLRMIKAVAILGFILLQVVLGFVIRKFYTKFDKEPEPTIQVDYFREIPDDLGPEVVSYLMYKNIKDTAISASFLEMIRKKAIRVEPVDPKQKDYLFIDHGGDALLTMEESYLKKWFIGRIGDGKQVLLSQIKNESKKYNTAQRFMENYEKWLEMVNRKAEQKHFYEGNALEKMGTVFLVLFCSIAVSFLCGMAENSFLAGIAFIEGFILTFYISLSTKRTQDGAEAYAKWNGLRKYLNDFGNFKEKVLPDIILWERYLVYAYLFGIASKLEKTMRLYLNQTAQFDMGQATLLNMQNIAFASMVNHAVSSSIGQARTVVASHNASNNNFHSSSGGGFGGGFSGGGGFGGGGGGGRGF